jgi:O-antigen/teichoic acid export membrane protein
MQESLKKNIIINYIRVFTTLLIPLITFPYISRVLMPENLGKVNFASSIIAYFIILASLGIPYYGIREAAKVKDNKSELSKLAQELLIINIIFTFISYLLLIITILIIPKFYEQKELLLLMSLSIMLTTIGIEWLYQALEKYVYITIRSLIFNLMYVVLVFAFIRNESDYYLYALFITLSTVGSNILNFINSRKYISFKPVKNYNFKRHIKPILVMMSMNLAISIYINLDVVMLGFMATDYAVGIYSVSIKLAKLSLAIVAAVGSILMARVTYYIQANKTTELDNLLSKATDFVFLSALPIIVFLTVFSNDVVYIISGLEYLDASLTLKILLPIILALGLSNLIGVQILIPLGREKLTLYSVIVGAIVNFSLNLLLIPRFAQDGAAFATVVAEACVTIIQIYFAWDYMKKALFTLNKLKYLLAVLLSTLLLIYFNSNGVENVLINLIIFGTSFSLLYMATLIILKEEIVYEILNMLKKYLR